MRWKVIGAALLIFVAGGVAGFSLGAYLCQAPVSATAKPPPGPPPLALRRGGFVQRLARELDLSKEQQERIAKILEEGQQKLRALWDPVAPKAREAMEEIRKRIESELSPEQRARFKEVFKPRGRRGPPGERHWGAPGRSNRFSGQGKFRPPRTARPPSRRGEPTSPPPPKPPPSTNQSRF